MIYAKKELSPEEYRFCGKMGITLNLPSKKGERSLDGFTGMGGIYICEDCITEFGFSYDDPYVYRFQRMQNILKFCYEGIINKAKIKLKFKKKQND